MMEELAIDSSNDECNSSKLGPIEQPRRLEPIGATTAGPSTLSRLSQPFIFTDESSESSVTCLNDTTSRLQLLEQEQEQLTGSLMSLTTHFAQVQFRLKQIVSAPAEQKEKLLKELEEFAFRGCPNVSKRLVDTSSSILEPLSAHEQIIEEQRTKQKELIDQLKNQLEDLESYAYQSGDLDLPSSLVMEKHKLILDELKEKINLPVDDLNKLSNEDIKKSVQNAICKIVNPIKIKEHLVTQLTTQIEDLERFIDFLQGDASSPGPYALKKKCKNCGEPTGDTSSFPAFQQHSKPSSSTSKSETHSKARREFENVTSSNESTIDLLKKVLSVMQIFAVSQMSCAGINSNFENNSLKKTSNHWGDLRANLELSVNKVLKLHANLLETMRKNKLKLNSAATESDEELNECPHELIRVVRKDLACSLRDLLQHGLFEVQHGTSMVPYGCFVVRSSKGNSNQLHAWDLFIKYYEMKHGKEFTQSATNKLSQSFSLNVVAGKTITTKQSLLNAIDTVYKVHKYDISNKDSCFKAFICLALNEKKLVLYLKQIFKTTIIIENYYQTWSYVKSTGADDSLKSLDQLKVLCSNFPVDKSIRRKLASNANKELF